MVTLYFPLSLIIFLIISCRDLSGNEIQSLPPGVFSSLLKIKEFITKKAFWTYFLLFYFRPKIENLGNNISSLSCFIFPFSYISEKNVKMKCSLSCLYYFVFLFF